MIQRYSQINYFIKFFFLFILFSVVLYPQEETKIRDNVQIPEPGLSFDYSVIGRLGLPLAKTETTALNLPAVPLNTFIVTTVDDAGDGSFRQAIEQANNNAGLDLIQFNISGTGIKTITPLTPLPDINDPVIIDGTTQADYSGKPMIEIDGVWLSGSDVHGLFINTFGCTIKGIAVNRFPGAGIYLFGGQNTIEGCFVGLYPGPVASARGNVFAGIVVISADNKIGNPSSNRNVISGNIGPGIFIFGQFVSGNNIIQNSYVGTNYDGNLAIPNKMSGIDLLQVSNCTIGGVGAFDRNVISGNTDVGIFIRGGLSKNITIKGNRIGTTADGNWPLGNKQGINVLHEMEPYLGSPSNILIGGKADVDKNLISGNSQAGIAFFLGNTGGSGNIVAGNYIGTNHNGTNKVGNNSGIYIQRTDTSGMMPGVRIGGSMSDSNNVISGNKEVGIFINGKGARNNLIFGNYIGITSPTAPIYIQKLGNGLDGILIQDASSNKIGDENPVRGNVISGNLRNGIFLKDANKNFIYNNYIGTYLTDGFDIGNFYHGIYIEGSNTTIGGAGLSNKIAFNKQSGIFIFSGTGNKLHLNSFYQNAALGIDLEFPGVTPNDSADVDTGPNLRQNFPFLDSVRLGSNNAKIFGRLFSKPNSTFTLHFYKSKQKSPLHFGEGQFYLDSIVVVTTDSGWVSFEKTINQTVKIEEFVTALAVDDQGNTSEFSIAFCQKDTDGDGIYDCWETQGGGIDINQDGIIDLNMHERGARPDHKDIFVEIDFITNFGPNDNALNLVKDAFKKVPNKYINNPDSEPGINLVIEHNDTPIPAEIFGENPWPKFHQIKKKYFGTQLEREHPNAKNLLKAKSLVYRYCIWASYFNGSSGLAENNAKGEGGNDFLITLGTFEKKNSDSVQAGTFMHELGHTLGLQHGGIDSINYKPNYISVMNYAWQTPQIKKGQDNLFWRLDYSRQELPPLTEDLLWEAKGFGSLISDYPDSVFVPFSNRGVADVVVAVMYPNTPVDWDGDGDVSGFASRPMDINDLNENSQPSPGQTLLGHNDWVNLKYNFRNSPFFIEDNKGALKKANSEEIEKEMTPEIYNYLQSLPPYGFLKPTLLPASLKWLGTLGGTESTPFDISDDGRVVVGTAEDSTYQAVAFRWTPETGMQSLGAIRVIDGGYWSEAYGVSGDGKIIVGMSYDSNYTQKAFKWTEEEGMIDLNIGSSAVAYDISGDGSTIVGYVYIDTIGSRGFRYRESTGLDIIGTFGGSSSSAMGVNYNGELVVGYADNFRGDPYAFLWYYNQEEGLFSMDAIGSRYSFANKIAGNGSVVTGFETGVAGRYRAFRWSRKDGLQLNILGNLSETGGDFSEGFDVTDDGDFIVGYAAEGAFRLSRDNQVEYYDEILKDDLPPGTELYSLTAVSSDGRFAVGVGYNPTTDQDEAFIIDTGGRILLTDVEEKQQVVVNSNYSLEQNYPNPFNPVTTIRYSVPSATQVVLTIYNILGQQVAKLVDEFKNAGRYEVKFDASRLASGIYLYNIQAGKYFETKKMILIK